MNPTLGQVRHWPPYPGEPDGEDGVFRGCEFVPGNVQFPAHLVVAIRYPGMTYIALFWNPSLDVLLRMARTLRGREVRSMSETKSLVLDADAA